MTLLSPNTARRTSGDPATRARLLESASAVFAEKDYLDVTVDDIIRRAGVARGTFYIYFSSKEQCFEALIEELVEEMYASATASGAGEDPFERIAAATRRYLEAFQAHAGLFGSVYQAGILNPRIGARRARSRQRFLARIQKHIERNVEAGVTTGLNPAVAAACLGLMVDWLAYLWLVKQEFPPESPFDMDTVVQTVTTIWCRALYGDGVAPREGLPSEDGKGSAGRTARDGRA